MVNKIFIHGGSSIITKFIVENFEKKKLFDEYHVFVRDLKRARSNLYKFKHKIIFYTASLEDCKSTFVKIKKLPNDLNSILWVSGMTGNAKEEFLNKKKCKINIDVNFTNIVLSINHLLENNLTINKNSFLCVLTSVAGLRGRNFNMFYGSANAALISYLSALRQKYNKILNVITVIPGYMKTRRFITNANNFFVSSPVKAANIICKAITKKKEIVYIDYKWKVIMSFIKIIPEIIFKKLKF